MSLGHAWLSLNGLNDCRKTTDSRVTKGIIDIRVGAPSLPSLDYHRGSDSHPDVALLLEEYAG